jgi:hypothetical protein
MLQPLTKNLTLGLSLSYRVMKINETVTGWFDTGGGWQVSPTRDYSSTSFGISLNYELH